MTDFERITMGSTYDEAFGQPSASIHYRAGASPQAVSGDEKAILAEASKIGLLAFCVVNRCFTLLGQPTAPAAEQIARAVVTNTEARRRFEMLNERPSIEVGDFVVARGYLGEVLQEATSSLGYRSLQVELLAERPIPSLSTDWFRARDVRRLFSRAEVLRQIAAAIGDADTARARHANLRDSVRELWNAGLREEIRRQMLSLPAEPRGDSAW